MNESHGHSFWSCQARHTTLVSARSARARLRICGNVLGCCDVFVTSRRTLPTFRSLCRHIQRRPLATRQCSSVSAPRQTRPGTGNFWQAYIIHTWGALRLRRRLAAHPGPALPLGDVRPPEAGLPRRRPAACERTPVGTAVIPFESSDSETI